MDKLTEIMDNLNVDALFLTDYFNKRYFTGFTGTTGLALVTRKNKYFFSDFRYTEQATLQVSPRGFVYRELPKNSYPFIAEIAKNDGVKKMGIDNGSVTIDLLNIIKKNFVDVELVSATHEFMKARQIKNAEEIANLKEAARISDIAYAETVKIIKEGITEKEIAAYIEYIQRINGADDKSFETIIASGYRSAMPHGVASDKKIAKEEFIVMDFGCYYNGYASDMTRTVYFGNNISDRNKEMYENVLKAQLIGIDLVKPGAWTDEIDKATRDYFESKEKGLSKYFGHSLGHSFGLEVHEEPYLSTVFHAQLEKDMFVTVEPGLYFEGFGGVRIEDDLLVTENGHEVLNKSPKHLVMIDPDKTK